MENALGLGLSLIFTVIGMFINHRMDIKEKRYSESLERALRGYATTDEMNWLLENRAIPFSKKQRMTLEQYSILRSRLEASDNYRADNRLKKGVE